MRSLKASVKAHVQQESVEVKSGEEEDAPLPSPVFKVTCQEGQEDKCTIFPD